MWCSALTNSWFFLLPKYDMSLKDILKSLVVQHLYLSAVCVAHVLPLPFHLRPAYESLPADSGAILDTKSKKKKKKSSDPKDNDIGVSAAVTDSGPTDQETVEPESKNGTKSSKKSKKRIKKLNGSLENTEDGKSNDGSWREMDWGKLAVAYLKKLSRQESSEFRKSLIASAGLSHTAEQDLDDFVKEQLSASPLLRTKGSKIGLSWMDWSRFLVSQFQLILEQVLKTANFTEDDLLVFFSRLVRRSMGDRLAEKFGC